MRISGGRAVQAGRTTHAKALRWDSSGEFQQKPTLLSSKIKGKGVGSWVRADMQSLETLGKLCLGLQERKEPGEGFE